MSKGISSAALNVLNVIRSLTIAFGFPPSVREVVAELGFTSPNSITGHLHNLRELGYILADDTRPGEKRSSRGLVIVGEEYGTLYKLCEENDLLPKRQIEILPEVLKKENAREAAKKAAAAQTAEMIQNAIAAALAAAGVVPATAPKPAEMASESTEQPVEPAEVAAVPATRRMKMKKK